MPLLLAVAILLVLTAFLGTLNARYLRLQPSIGLMLLALGMDFDSYEPLAGSPYYQKALTIAQRSQSTRNAAEWQGQSNQYSRMNFLSELMNAQYERFREGLYWYYYEGLDFLETEPEFARRAVAKALEAGARAVICASTGRWTPCTDATSLGVPVGPPSALVPLSPVM